MVRRIKITPQKSSTSSTNEISDDIKLERENATLVSEKRLNTFVNILSGSPADEINYYKALTYGFGSLASIIMSTLGYTLIPVHDVIKYPEYWYEYPLQLACCCLPYYAANMILRSSFYLNVERLQNLLFYFKALIGIMVLFLISFTTAHLAWNKIGGYQGPIPFTTYIIGIAMPLILLAIIWNHIPRQWRKTDSFKKRLRSLVFAVLLSHYLAFLSVFVIGKLFLLIPRRYQWVIAFFLPLIREINIWLSSKLARRATDGDQRKAEIVCSQAMGAAHTLNLLYTIGSIATLETAALVLGLDFLTNIYICCKIIYLKKKKQDTTRKQVELLQDLVINEMIELFLPLADLASLLIAYFGPNSQLIGHVGSQYWQYNPIDDLDHNIRYILMFFFVDLGSLFASGALLWFFCRIQLHQAFIAIQSEFGVVFTIQMGDALGKVCVERFHFFL